MHRAAAHDPATAASTPTVPPPALPWEWFAFSQARAQIGPALAHTHHITLDGQLLPFRFIQNTASAKPRPALLLMHGMGLTVATFRGVSGHLFQTHDLILPDYSQFTRDSFTAPPSFKSMSLSLWRIADFLGLDTLTFAGNSLGAGLALIAALHHPRRVSAILLANPAVFPQKLPRMYRIVRYPLIGELFMSISPPARFVAGVEYIGYVDKTRFDPALRKIYADNLRPRKNRLRLMDIIRQLPADQQDLASADHLRRLGELTMPVLISWGEQDPLLTPGAGERLARALPNATLDLYPDLAHMPHEEAPERVGPRWCEFLRSLPAVIK